MILYMIHELTVKKKILVIFVGVLNHHHNYFFHVGSLPMTITQAVFPPGAHNIRIVITDCMGHSEDSIVTYVLPHSPRVESCEYTCTRSVHASYPYKIPARNK